MWNFFLTFDSHQNKEKIATYLALLELFSSKCLFQNHIEVDLEGDQIQKMGQKCLHGVDDDEGGVLEWHSDAQVSRSTET